MNKKIIVIFCITALLLSGCTSFTSNSNSDETEKYISDTASEESAEETQETATKSEEFEVVNITDENFESTVPNTTGLAVVDFWAEWCGPCVALGPILENVCADKGVQLFKVDVDQNPELSKEFEISAIPMVHIYKDGQLVDSFVGLVSQEEFESLLDSNK